MCTEKTSAEEMHSIIHEAHEQAIAFAQILEFVGYKDFFYGGTFININCELNEISEAADLVNGCVFDLKENNNLDLKQSQVEINLIYSYSNEKITQELNEMAFQTGILSSEKLDILFLVSQRHKHEAYSSQRMERIQITPRYETDDLASNFNSNKINNIIALNQNEGAKSGIIRAKRWQQRNRLETLERHSNAPALPRISVANVTTENPAKCGGYAFALFGSKIYLVQFLAMYRQSSNYHSYVDDTVTCIDSLSYISVRVYEEQAPNIFGCFSVIESRKVPTSKHSFSKLIKSSGTYLKKIRIIEDKVQQDDSKRIIQAIY
ncbi:hypothetical protein C1645_812283 [Glomus cerebriforme]|uniref:Uncharacterized protein n=1 Tax=Glomus cerebriforme TaxID=658196 RepID=A0A397TMZ4_9GLOM|nr:hypothetical protein C1645_812283 [Glomus cerebriforme]